MSRPERVPRKNCFSLRTSADENFRYKLAVDIIIDQIVTFCVNVRIRGNPHRWKDEIQLIVLVQSISALLNDIALVVFLSPTGGSNNKIPAHCFQKGDFKFFARVICGLQKLFFYSLIGGSTASLSYICGQAILSNTTLHNIQYDSRNLKNTTAIGALSLGLSSNLRYQILNGIEQVIPNKIKFAKLIIASLRMINNLAGAYLWIVISRLHLF